jgi:hypothetical protein
MRDKYRGKIVMVRPDAASLSLVAFMKEDGERTWTRCPEQHPIPRNIMLPGYSMPNRIELPGGGGHGPVGQQGRHARGRLHRG